MNRPGDMIAEQEAKVASLRERLADIQRELGLEEAYLRGMKDILLIPHLGRPGPDVVLRTAKGDTMAVEAKRFRGRQPGAISHEWRDTLGILFNRGSGWFSIDDVVAAAHSSNLPKVRARDADDRMRAYIDLGYVERQGDGYRVSEIAAEKYGFSRPETTEAPTADAEGAS